MKHTQIHNTRPMNNSKRNSLLAVVAIIIISLYSCNDNSEKSTFAPQSITDTLAQPQFFFPIYDFLKSEISKVDSTPIGIKKYTTSALANDSGYIDRNEFHVLTEEFLPRELHDSTFRSEFRESSFLDNSTGAATFYYSTTNPEIDLKRADVVTEKTDTYDRVKSIYLEKKYSSGKNIINKKLYWKSGSSFQIITQTQNENDTETNLIKVVWDY